MMKAALRKLLKRYRPYDQNLRKNKLYREISEYLFFWARLFLRRNTAINYPAQVGYTHNLGRVSANPDCFLFESYWGRKIADHPLSVFRALTTDPKFESYNIYWSLKKGTNPPAELDAYPQVKFIDPNSFAYGAALLQAKYLVNNVTFPPFFIRQPEQVYCNTWHGVPMKAMGRDMNAPLISMANTQRNYLQATVLPSSSTYYTEKAIEPYYIAGLAAECLFRTGSPRVDDILHPKISAAVLKARFGVREGQKVVLMALTWRGTSTQIKDTFNEQLSQFQETARLLGPDYFVLFSAHQMMRTGNYDLPHGGAFIEEGENINDILTIVDVLVSDYSSIIFDFLPLDRPITLFVPDLEEYRGERGLYIAPKDLPCASATTLDDLADTIRVAKRPSEFPDFGTHQATYFPHEDGQAASKLLDRMLAAPATQTAHAGDRKRLLFAPGGMMPNGITASLKNLIANLDYDRFDPYVVIDAKVVDNDAARAEQFFGFDPRCNWIFRCGEMLRRYGEGELYNAFRKGKRKFTEPELAQIKTMFERESQRILGNATFDVAIEFGGYSPYWTGVTFGARAHSHVIYQHNHLWAEATNPDPNRNQEQLMSVFQSYRWFDKIFAVSDETRDVNRKHLAAYYRDGTIPQTVQNTINPPKILANASVPLVFSDQRAAAILKEEGVTSFVALGRLSPEKRYDRMIAAFAEVAKKHPKAILFICGRGPLEQALRQQIQRHSLSSNVFLMGHVSNPHSLLKACDACVMSSDYEGQPMALLEAQCLHVPCIGTDIPGIRSVLKDGRGTIVPPNAASLAKAMCLVAEKTLPPARFADVTTYVTRSMEQFYSAIGVQADQN